ncbi:MAG: iron-sulfur cluster assembly accessory protein, partial [uncultured bacterium]
FPSNAPRLAQELTNAGLNCVGCSAATWETLEAGFYGHGMEDHEIGELLSRLNHILNEQVNLSKITITKRAAKKYKEILKADGKEGWSLRFGERAAGCSGFEYFLDYSEKSGKDDMVLESEGIQIHIHKQSKDRLMGSTIDYVDGLQGAGFKITNPNVKASCGCGSSHGY